MKLFAFTILLGLMPAVALAAPAETPVQAPGPSGPLRGTMLAPESASGGPAVLIIPGSGPTNRDGNNPLGLRGSTYKLLAQGLAAKGITTVRIDKRGMFGSSRAIANANAVTIADYADDVRAWVRVIRDKTGAPCVWILGHSEGGLVALSASRSVSDACGLVLVASPGRPAGQILQEQLKSDPANARLLGQALPAIKALEAGRHVDASALHPALMPLFNPSVQNFLIDMFSLDPARLIAGYRKPVLIVQGERDIQVSVADATRLKEAEPNAKLLLLPNTNHMLKTVASTGRAANTATYANPSLPLAPGIADGIADFVISPPVID